MNRLEKLTSQKSSLNSYGADKIYPDHANSLCEAGLTHTNLPTMGDLWKNQDEKLDIENEKEPDVNKKKNRNFYFCVAYSRYFSTYIHRVINKLKVFNLYWLRVRMSNHRFNNLDELLSGDFSAKVRRGIISKDLMDR